jgi:hypothetical protein
MTGHVSSSHASLLSEHQQHDMMNGSERDVSSSGTSNPMFQLRHDIIRGDSQNIYNG